MSPENIVKEMKIYCSNNSCYSCKVDKLNPNHTCGRGSTYTSIQCIPLEELKVNSLIAIGKEVT